MEKKYNFVYKTTNIKNGKIYIGVHSTNDLDDSYIGSGRRFSDAKKHYGEESFKREILEFFETRYECYQKEKELVTSEFVARNDTYNITEGGYGVLTHSPEGIKKISEYRTNKAVMKDEKGNIVSIDKNDPKFLSLVGHTKGMVCAKDKEGREVFISKDEFGSRKDLVGRTKGLINVKLIETGENLLIKIEDYDKSKYVRFTTGKITVKDKDGNTFQVSKNDPKYLSGELVGVRKGIKIRQLNKRKLVKCPHCNKEGDSSNMKRWHFNNCKFKTN